MPGLISQVRAWFAQPVEPEAPLEGEDIRQARFSLAESENTLLVGVRQSGGAPFDRPGYSREDIQQECLEAWRYNPIARRLVELTTQYTTGGGLVPRSKEPAVQALIDEFWRHPLNRMDLRVTEFSNELVRSGNLFLLISTDAAGMSYVRMVPSSEVSEIVSRENDVEQELAYLVRDRKGGEPQSISAFRAEDSGRLQLQPAMLHYAVNRPAGAQWGEPDLAPVLKWLARYTAWLEDRVRLNRFRNAFVYVVKADFVSEAARSARQLQLTANPPAPGSVLVTDTNEEWSVLSPKLEALDASADGLAIKKMIAAGMGVPLHFLAEPESSTKTTAEAAGNPTYRRFEERQRVLCWMMEDLLRGVVARKAVFDERVHAQADIRVSGGDISSRDNTELASAGSQVVGVARQLYDQGLIGAEELLRLVYRFMGEKQPETPPGEIKQ